MKIGIIVAMGGEFRLVEALLSGKKEQEIFRNLLTCSLFQFTIIRYIHFE